MRYTNTLTYLHAHTQLKTDLPALT